MTQCLAEPTDRQQAFTDKLAEFTGYIKTNAGYICNYGERHRCGEAISSSIAESAVNHVSARMVKKQQMRWSSRGAHLLLQLRTRVLNVRGAAVPRLDVHRSEGERC